MFGVLGLFVSFFGFWVCGGFWGWFACLGCGFDGCVLCFFCVVDICSLGGEWFLSLVVGRCCWMGGVLGVDWLSSVWRFWVSEVDVLLGGFCVLVVLVECGGRVWWGLWMVVVEVAVWVWGLLFDVCWLCFVCVLLFLCFCSLWSVAMGV